MRNENQWCLSSLASHQQQRIAQEATDFRYLKVFTLVIFGVFELVQQVLGKVDNRGSAARVTNVGIISKAEDTSLRNVVLERKKCPRPEQSTVLVLRPCLSTGPSKSVNKDDVRLGPRGGIMHNM